MECGAKELYEAERELAARIWRPRKEGDLPPLDIPAPPAQLTDEVLRAIKLSDAEVRFLPSDSLGSLHNPRPGWWVYHELPVECIEEMMEKAIVAGEPKGAVAMERASDLKYAVDFLGKHCPELWSPLEDVAPDLSAGVVQIPEYGELRHMLETNGLDDRWERFVYRSVTKPAALFSYHMGSREGLEHDPLDSVDDLMVPVIERIA